MLSLPIKGTKRVLETRPPVGFIEPLINGSIDDFYEWANAGCYEVDLAAGVMYGGIPDIRCLYFGFSLENFYARIDYRGPIPEGEPHIIHFYIRAGRDFEIVFPLTAGWSTYTLSVSSDATAYVPVGEYKRLGVGTIVELYVPFVELGLKGGESLSFFVEIKTDGVAMQRCPRRGSLSTQVPGENFEKENWSA